MKCANSLRLKSIKKRFGVERLECRVQPSSGFYTPPSNFQINPAYATVASRIGQQPLDIALTYLNNHAGDFGATQADLVNPIVTSQYTDADSGTTHLYLRQQVNGLEVQNADLSISILANGSIFTIGGGFVANLRNKIAAQPVGRVMSPIEAVKDAASGLGLQLQAQPLMPVIMGPLSQQPKSYEVIAPSISTENIKAQLHYVPTADGSAVLAWELIIQTPDGQHWYDLSVNAASGEIVALADWVDSDNYSVLPSIIESPQDGGFAVLTNPANPTASPFGWHDTNGVAGAEFTTTVGNNVDAHLDRDGNNSADASPPRPDGGTTLEFSSYTFDAAQVPSVLQNENAAVVNLFYINNAIHDINYLYGFIEAAGNFQTNNYGKGGTGNDAVQADAQDGSGTNNANFGTPVEGSAPRMQMFEWTLTTPRRDSDLDNGIIIHEYTHGVSNRLTGGPGNVNALNNSQSGGMGEGWSDFFGLMLLQKPTDTQNAGYGIGTYVLGQAQSGVGIRRFPYSFNMATDPLTFDAYGSSGTTSYGVTRSTEVHNVGELWCSALWDLNWLLINKYGYDPNLATGYTAAAGPGHAGNKLTLKLVMDAMKLQVANPSFTQARDAIIAADVALNGGADRFEIWSAFARRGLGVNASDGGSASTINLTPDTSLPMVVASVVPATGNVVTVHPASYVVNVTSAIDPATLQASDFVVNGQAATGLSYTAGSTSATFTFTVDPVTAEGPQSIAIAASAFTRASDSSPVTAFTSNFYVDATSLHVTSLSPALGIVPLPLTTIDVNLDGAIDPASVQNSDLSITMGSVTGFTLLNSNTTVRFTVSNLVNETSFYAYVAAGAFADSNGSPNAVFTGGTYSLDYTTFPFPTPLIQRNLQGSMVYDGTFLANVGFAGDLDNFTLNLDAGQSLNVVITPSSSLRPSLTVIGPGTSQTNAAATNGATAQLQLIPITTAGTYTFRVSGSASTIGAYSIVVTLNQVSEAESNGGASNDTTGTAQDINAAFTTVAGGMARATVRGRSDVVAQNEAEPNDATGTATVVSTATAVPANLYQLAFGGSTSASNDVDYYSIGTMQVGDVLTFTASGSPSLRGVNADALLRLYRAGATTTILATDDDSGPGFDALVYRYTVTTADTYSIRVSQASSTIGTYQVGVLLENTSTVPTTGGTYSTESASSNNTIGTAENASTSWRTVGYQLTSAGTISSGDTDFYSYQFTAGDVVTALNRSTSTLSPALALLNSGGTVIAIDDGSDSIGGAGGISPMYGYVIPSTGTYYMRVTGASATTGSYLNDVYLSTTATLTVSGSARDLYSMSLSAGQSVSTALKGITAGVLHVAVLDTAGTVAASGGAGSTNLTELVANYVAPIAGTYYVQVTGAANLDYQVVVVTGGTFDSEANDSFATAQLLSVNNAAVGYITAANTDYYQVTVAAGNSLTVTTTTPGGGTGQFVNNLDPLIEIYDPSNNLVGNDDNSVGDGKNATLAYNALVSGNYRVRVLGVGGSAGEYAINAVIGIGGTPLNVTIDQALGQADPTNSATINYSVVFTATVSDFATGDVTLSGTAGATTAVVTGSGTTYNVAVSGMTGSGTVIASLLPGIATSGANNSNASTSTDNSVTYDGTLPTGTSTPANVTAFGATSYTFTVTFSDNLAVSVASLDGNDIRVTGPGAFDVPAFFVGVDININGTPRTATYSITPPGGSWNSVDNGAYNVVLQSGQVLDGVGNAAATATVGSFNVNVPAPSKLTNVQVNDGSAQRSRVTSLLLTFDSPVTLPGTPANAFQLKRQSDNAVVGLTAVPTGNTVTVTFTSGPVDANSLADGRYTLNAFATQINSGNFDGDGNGVGGDDYSLVGNPANGLFRLFGDADGDASVAANDFIEFRLALGGSNNAFDFDNDGAVVASDFIQFRLRFGGSI